jgi:hypothetical protein
MPETTDRLRLRARHPAGVSTATFAIERAGSVLGHAVLRERNGGRWMWHVTDGEAPPFLIEATDVHHDEWILMRTDGAPFGRVAPGDQPSLDLMVVAGNDETILLGPGGVLTSARDGGRLGRVELTGPHPETPDGADLQLRARTLPTVRASLLSVPLCLLQCVSDRPAAAMARRR